jgi:hypothetical protein
MVTSWTRWVKDGGKVGVGMLMGHFECPFHRKVSLAYAYPSTLFLSRFSFPTTFFTGLSQVGQGRAFTP